MKKFNASVLIASMLASTASLASYDDGDFDDVVSYDRSTSYEYESYSGASRAPAGDYEIVNRGTIEVDPTYDKRWRKLDYKKHKIRDKYHSAQDRGRDRQAARLEKRYYRLDNRQARREARLLHKERKQLIKSGKYRSSQSGSYSSGSYSNSGYANSNAGAVYGSSGNSKFDYSFEGGTFNQSGKVHDTGWYSVNSGKGSNSKGSTTVTYLDNEGYVIGGNSKGGKGKTNEYAEYEDDVFNENANAENESGKGKGKTNENANANEDDVFNENANAEHEDDVIAEVPNTKGGTDKGKGKANTSTSGDDDVFNQPNRKANTKGNSKGNSKASTTVIVNENSNAEYEDDFEYGKAENACSGNKDCRQKVRQLRRAQKKVAKLDDGKCTTAECQALVDSIQAQLEDLELCYPNVKREFFGKRWARGAGSWVSSKWRRLISRKATKGDYGYDDGYQPSVTDNKGKNGKAEVIADFDSNEDANESVEPNPYLKANVANQVTD